jgi:hypothetical protein
MHMLLVGARMEKPRTGGRHGASPVPLGEPVTGSTVTADYVRPRITVANLSHRNQSSAAQWHHVFERRQHINCELQLAEIG